MALRAAERTAALPSTEDCSEVTVIIITTTAVADEADEAGEAGEAGEADGDDEVDEAVALEVPHHEDEE